MTHPLAASSFKKYGRIASPTRCALVLFCGIVTLGGGCGQKHESAPIDASTKDGEPRTLAELDAWYAEPPDGQNAATINWQGFGALQLGRVSTSNLPILGKGSLPALGCPLPGSMKSAVTAFVRANQDAVQFFAEGSRHEDSRYPVILSRGIDTIFPHLAPIKNAARIMELSAVLHAEAKDGKKAADDVLIALALARSLTAEPALLSQGVRAASISIALSALEQTVNRTALPADSLRDLSKAFQKLEESDARGESYTRALIAERINLSALLGTPPRLLEMLPALGTDLPPEVRSQIAARLQKAKNLKPEQQFFEETFRQLMPIREGALPDRLKIGDLIRHRVSQAADAKLAVLAWLIPGLAKDVVKEAACLASLRLGLAAVALEQFRAAHADHYPDGLGELSPGFLSGTLEDPFDGKPLRYRRKGGEGYVLYSIGPDLKDDSGEPLKDKVGDIVFAVITPPASAHR